MRKTWISYAAAAALAFAAVRLAFSGPPGGDINKQRPKYHIDFIPPAPVLSPEEELKTFKLPPGFHIELVAAEPMVQEPVALAFDPDARMYVVEMRGYMPDIKGTGEMAPVGRVSRLESSNHDGKYDKSAIFLDGLVIPRSVGFAGKGVLVGEPPNVWFCRDTKGDGHADEKTLVFSNFGHQSADAEYNPNGFMRDIDNWYYDADWPLRFNYLGRKFHQESTTSRGQYGIAQDDDGRLFFNNNSNMLRCDLVPAETLTANPLLDAPAGLNVMIAKNATFPSRVNPGVNRGYTADLNLQGKLQRNTAACGPTIYRGDQFPADYRGNAFVCEPAGNLVSRQVLTSDGLQITAKSVQHDGLDFLTSTDERFRPVFLTTAPDGSLFLVDMYHGILQHKVYISAYLADQIKKRDLENNDGHRGRIWRIYADGAPLGPQPNLSKAKPPELVRTLSNPNGWWRDTAQRLLVERGDINTVPLLEKVVKGESPDATPLAKIHALWTLAGIDGLDDGVAAAATRDLDPQVRVAALRAAGLMIRKRTASATIKAMLALASDPDPAVQLQVLAMSAPDLPDLQAAGTRILIQHLGDPIFRAAAVSGATGRELETLKNLLGNPAFAGDGERALLSELADCVIQGRNPDKISQLIAQIAAISNTADQESLMEGVTEALAPPPKSHIVARRLRLPKEPSGLSELVGSSNVKIKELATRAASVMSWPGKPGDTTPPLKPLTEEEQKLFDNGREVFAQICSQCHQPSGLGQAGTAPRLVDSEWLLGPKDRVVRIVLDGLHGPIAVAGRTTDLEMPGLKALSDEQIASALTFLRRNWGHEADPISVTTVNQIRQQTTDRGDELWTAEELSKIK